MTGLVSGIVLSMLPLASAIASEGPALRAPIDCDFRKNCWVINYFDHDPGEEIIDFTGGTNLYNGHQGIDFAIPNMTAMLKGVPVVAAADGKVVAIRDHIPDIGSVTRDGKRIDFPMCGNAVLIEHGNDYRTQYCHLRRGSISVAAGDTVEAGHQIGLVGLSGFTNFPHVHLAVSRGKEKVDPFTGPGWKPGSGMPLRPMWTDEAREKLAYQPFVLMDAGFTGGRFEKQALLNGWYRKESVPLSSSQLVFAMLIYYLDEGDLIDMKVTAPDGKVVHQETTRSGGDAQRSWRHISLARPVDGWQEGEYTGEVTVTRNGDEAGSTQTILRKVFFEQ
jgi:hypothetical protein